jgi:DNA-binding MarR family transcriptional regulator
MRAGMKKYSRASSRVARHELLTVEVLKQFRLVYGAVHRHFRAVERRCGLSGAQAWILRELARTPSLGVSELATRLSVHQSTASQLIEKLVSSGHVERVAHEVDARRVQLHLTRKGMACVRRLPEPAEGVLPRALGRLPAASLRALNVNLARLTTQLQTRRSRDAQATLDQL